VTLNQDCTGKLNQVTEVLTGEADGSFYLRSVTDGFCLHSKTTTDAVLARYQSGCTAELGAVKLTKQYADYDGGDPGDGSFYLRSALNDTYCLTPHHMASYGYPIELKTGACASTAGRFNALTIQDAVTSSCRITTFDDAGSSCLKHNMRLCSVGEVRAGQGIGCGGSFGYGVWTRDGGGKEHYETGAAASASGHSCVAATGGAMTKDSSIWT